MRPRIASAVSRSFSTVAETAPGAAATAMGDGTGRAPGRVAADGATAPNDASRPLTNSILESFDSMHFISIPPAAPFPVPRFNWGDEARDGIFVWRNGEFPRRSEREPNPSLDSSAGLMNDLPARIDPEETAIGNPLGDPAGIGCGHLFHEAAGVRDVGAEARAHGIAPVTRDHPAYPFMRDGDGDGVVRV